MPNLSTILISLVIGAIFVAIVAKGIYNRIHHKGGCSCGGSCGTCGACGHTSPTVKKSK